MTDMKVDVRKLLCWLGLLKPGKVMYIGGSDVLPPPLKPAEEQALLARLAEGATIGELEKEFQIPRLTIRRWREAAKAREGGD